MQSTTVILNNTQTVRFSQLSRKLLKYVYYAKQYVTQCILIGLKLIQLILLSII